MVWCKRQRALMLQRKHRGEAFRNEIERNGTAGGTHHGFQCHGLIDIKMPMTNRKLPLEEFDQVVAQIADLVKAGVDINRARFYPVVKKRLGLGTCC